MRYRLRTLLIFLALVPPALAGAWFCFMWLADARNQSSVPAVLVLVALYLVAGSFGALCAWSERLGFRNNPRLLGGQIPIGDLRQPAPKEGVAWMVTDGMAAVARSQKLGDAIRLGVSMLVGAFLGFMLFTPVVGSDYEEDMAWSVRGVVVGTIAGAIVWKIGLAFLRKQT